MKSHFVVKDSEGDPHLITTAHVEQVRATRTGITICLVSGADIFTTTYNIYEYAVQVLQRVNHPDKVDDDALGLEP